MELFLSIIVPTVDRTAELRELLHSLERMGLGEDTEIIVVDQNEDDRLRSIIASFSSTLRLRHFPFSVRHANQARNWGAGLSSARWLAFADDDCLYREDTVARLRQTIDDFGPMVVLGSVSDLGGRALGGASGEGILRFRHLFHHISETALFIRRDWFMAMGGFSEAFGPGSARFAAEGIEFVYRTMRSPEGRSAVRFQEEVQVLHPRRSLTAARDKPFAAGYRYAYGVGAVIRHHRMWGASLYLLVYFAKIGVKLAVFPFIYKRYALACFKGMLYGLLHAKAAYDESR